MPNFEEIVERANEARTRIKEISPGSAEELLAAGAVLLDVREEREYRSGHLSGAVQLPWTAVDHGIEKIASDKSTPIVCYCTIGHRSAIAADTLQQLGYTAVTSIAGGLKAYLADADARKTA